MRHAFLLATIFSLLLCPYRCMGSLVVGIVSAQDEQAPVCPCCRAHQPQRAADSPGDERAPVETGDDCCACLCEGAILSEDDRSLASVGDSPGFAALPLDIERAALFDAAPGLTRLRADSPPLDTRPAGRHLLFAVQSLLL